DYAAGVTGVPEPVPVPAWDQHRAASGRPEFRRRELEVLRALAAGRTNKEIAAQLGLTPKTVMHYSCAIYQKLGVRGRAAATAWAVRNGFAAPD
ncbi:MAG: LuxR C-terminal-related transcriptional regulator, partial [Micropruina sp.]|uniref:helix-turn-helix domain-containing protein n=1 Tax=Micropruina sp. TaxID=2737536 RepID=UPI0039E363F5